MNEESEQLMRTTDVSCVVRITSESNPRATRLTARRSNGSALHTLDHQFSKSRAQKVRAQTPILPGGPTRVKGARSEEHTSELQSRLHLVCRLLLEKKKNEHEVHILRCVAHAPGQM